MSKAVPNPDGPDPGPEFVERRKSRRVRSSALASIKSTRLMAGKEIRLVNVSRQGALLESDSRVLPGSRVCLRVLSSEGVFLVAGRVLRSRALTLRGSVIIYESAVQFDEEFPLFPDTQKRPADLVEAGAAESRLETLEAFAAESGSDLLTLTLAIPHCGATISDSSPDDDLKGR